MPSYPQDVQATLRSWIRQHTTGAACVVDLGAGFFDKLSYAHPMVKKIGIEIFPSYTAHAAVGVVACLGDMREWDKFINPKDRDVAMMIDTIEHIPKVDGFKMLASLKESFRKILVMTPDGYYRQDDDPIGTENEYQVHECGWTKEELEAEGFVVESLDWFHGPKGGALFAAWDRP